MPYYVAKNNSLLVSSHKVMSSSLNRTKGLIRLNRLDFLFYYLRHFALRRSAAPVKIMLSRDPIARAISVYKEKFLGIAKYSNQPLQDIHKSYMNFSNFNKNVDFSNIANFFSSVRIEKYIDFLEKNFEKDAHTRLQKDLTQLRIGGVKVLSITFDKYFCIHDHQHLKEIELLLDVQMEKINRSASKFAIELDDFDKSRLYKIYEEDYSFLRANYDGEINHFI